MANNMHKEEWIDAAMNSTRGMRRADPPASIFPGITSRLSKPGKILVMPVKQWAAAAILLLALNIGSVMYFTNHNKNTEQSNPMARLTAEMQLESTYNY